MPFKRLFKDNYAGSSPENASVVRTLFDLFYHLSHLLSWCKVCAEILCSLRDILCGIQYVEESYQEFSMKFYTSLADDGGRLGIASQLAPKF